MSLAERVRLLEAENERLTQRNEELEQILGLRLAIPVSWGLTRKEREIVGLLLAREEVSKDAMMTALYAASRDREPFMKVLDVLICKLRKKLSLRGLSIETRWGLGWFLTPETKARLRAQIEDTRSYEVAA